MKKILLFFCITLFAFGFSQVNKKDTVRTNNSKKEEVSVAKSKSEKEVISDIEKANAPISTLKYSPTKAGLYSAVLPGLGQYYNKKYWKIPIVWGAIGTGVGVILYNQKQYERYRNAFVAELNGQTHEFSGIAGVDKTVLGNAQDSAKRYRDYAIAVSALVYILNVVDAVVDAHLYEGRHDKDLTFKPAIMYDQFGNQNLKTGLSLNYNF